MKNTLNDLNNYLFEQLEILDDEELSGEDLDRQLKKTDRVVRVAQTIIKNGELALGTMRYMDENGYTNQGKMPAMLEIKDAKAKMD